MIRYFFCLFLISCNPQIDKNNISFIIEDIKKNYAPDKRVSLFDIDFSIEQKSIVLRGETNIPTAKKELLTSFKKNNILYVDSIKILPSQELFGIINNSVANLRAKPSHSSELVSQTLLGTNVKVLKRVGEWYLIQTPDNYISWIDHGGIELVSKEFFIKYNAEKYFYNQPHGYSYESPKMTQIVSDLVVGSILNVIDKENNLSKIQYPDERIGWVETKNLIRIQDLKIKPNNFIDNSKKFLGIPYLWGGTSSKGFDCSGFTKTIYLMNGLVIPRDASQQVNEGILVDNSRNWENLKPGDLMFFGYIKNGVRRIDHVAMWLGDGKFIQASKNVRINSVFSDDPLYDKYHMDKYFESRRLLGNITSGISLL